MFDPSVKPSLVLDLVPSKNDWYIAIQKGTHSTCNRSPHYTNFSYHRLSPIQYSCLSSLSSILVPKSLGEALK